MTTATEQRRSLVQSLSRGLKVLEGLAGAGEVGLMELAAGAGLRPSTAHRLLATLRALGYVSQNPANGRYRLSYKMLEIASQITKASSHLCELARPHLEAIRELTGETVNLVILDRTNVVFLDQVAGSRSIRMFADVGVAMPAHTTAAGKAILAFEPVETIQVLYRNEPFERRTANTITTLEELTNELAKIRSLGYAVDLEEHEEGAGCVAAPILGPERALGAVSVSAPAPRILSRDIAKTGQLIRSHATQIGAAVASEPSQGSFAAAAR